ncbi:MAG: type III pantothenate kinase, partial [Oscillospiraceae bacterium]
ILACVVPALSQTIKSALGYLYSGKIFVVGPGLKSGLKIKAENPTQVGASLVCQSVAILDKYTPPCILISMGTALSIFALDESSTFIGGAILPGVRLSAKALCEHTAQLPQIDLSQKIRSVIGTTSAQNIQSGLIFGAASTIDGMVCRFKEVLGQSAVCVGTGELTEEILSHCKCEIFYEENLVLDGLRIIWQRNAK